jgi:hypothetical protein
MIFIDFIMALSYLLPKPAPKEEFDWPFSVERGLKLDVPYRQTLPTILRTRNPKLFEILICTQIPTMTLGTVIQLFGKIYQNP